MLSNKFVALTEQYSGVGVNVPAPMLRKEFFVEKKVEKAEIYICGLGFYRLWINGKEITKGYLSPYISNPEQIQFYDKYEVSAYLKTGKNVIGILLGNGFQNEDINAWNKKGCSFRSAPKVALSFEINGEVLFEATDGFKGYSSAIQFDSLRMGEFYDARYEIEDWNKVGYDDSEWQEVIAVKDDGGKKCVCDVPPIQVYKQIKAVKVYATKRNSYIFDFGENNAGIVELTIKGRKGQTIDIFFGEIASLDGLNCKPIYGMYVDGYFQHLRYTCKGAKKESYMPSFTYFGFRYAEVFGLYPDQASVDILTYKVMSTRLKIMGEFSCSSEMVNRIQEATLRSDLSNFYHFPTDCPHREKNGWTGDVSLSCEQMLMNFDAKKSLETWEKCCVLSQREDGAIPGIVPNNNWGFAWGNGPAWDVAMFEVPYMIYKLYGDLTCFKESEQAIDKYYGYMLSKLNKDGLVAYGLIDWCYVREPLAYEDVTPPTLLEISDTLTLLHLCSITAILYDAIGEKEKSEKWGKAFKNFREAFRKKHIEHNTKEVFPASQTGQAMAIYYGAFDEDEKTLAVQRLKELIWARDGHFDCGVLGLRVIFRVLSDNNEAELAYKMITRADYPSYAMYVHSGDGTLWEQCLKGQNVVGSIPGYYVNDKEKVVNYSLNHHFRGDVSGCFFEMLGGIKINPHLNNHLYVELKPSFIEDIDWVKCSRKFVDYGDLVVEWHRMNNKIEVYIQVPKGVCVVWKDTGEILQSGQNVRFIEC